jgi:hypothetical protein
MDSLFLENSLETKIPEWNKQNIRLPVENINHIVQVMYTGQLCPCAYSHIFD